MRISDWSSDVCSSDLCFLRQAPEAAGRGGLRWLCREDVQALLCAADGSPVAAAGPLFPHAADRLFRGHRQRTRSEEHTSELQSLMRNSYAVFCLKKKKTCIPNICRTRTNKHLEYTLMHADNK